MFREYYLFIALLGCLLLSGCLKKEYGATANTNGTDTETPVYKTIADLRTMMGNTGTTAIGNAIVISGVVTANDRSGNLYKQIIIDDGTAAMPLLLDAYNLYSDYPTGCSISVFCKGLYASYYYKLPRLGYLPDQLGSVSPIPVTLFEQFIRKGTYNNAIQPLPVMVEDAARFQSELLNRLIGLENVQFSDTLAGSYALPAILSSATNRYIMDCDSHLIAVRTSGYASFSAFALPKGKGSITAIYTVYNNTPQLLLRDTSDVHLYDTRCP